MYWSNEGRVSVELIGLAGACLGLVLIGISPFEFVNDVHVEAFGLRIALSTTFILHAIVVRGLHPQGQVPGGAVRVFRPVDRLDLRDPAGPAAVDVGTKVLSARSAGPGDPPGEEVRRPLGPDAGGGCRTPSPGRPSDENTPDEAKLPSDPVTDDDVRASAGTAT